jgi:hypothetical protein
MPLDVSVLQQRVLPLDITEDCAAWTCLPCSSLVLPMDVSVLQQPVLSLNVPVLQQPVLRSLAACAAPGVSPL